VRDHFDAIVVGAGPGGASAAYDLATAGARTLLLDKQKLPRHKTCGGGVTHKVAQALPFDISPVIERTIHTVVFSYKMAQPAALRSEQPLVYMVRRNLFDNLLTEQAVRAGATLLDETAVQSLDVTDEGATVRTQHGTFTSSWLVGADGATGVVARSLNLMQDRILMPAVEEEVEVSDDVAEYWHDKMGLDLGSVPASYGWVFPKADHLNVGVGGIAHDTGYGARLKQYDVEHLNKRVPQKTRVRKNFGYMLPLRKAGSPITKGRALLVGDAAGLVEAFTGEGIYWAVRSGQLAAKVIGDSLLAIGDGSPIAPMGQIIGHSQSPSAAYETLVNAELMPDLISARRWAHLYFWLPRFCYALPKHWQPMWRAVCKIVRGERGFSHIRRKLGAFGFLEDLLPAAV
jgi:geranylgeranyl reductase family protein